MKKILMMLTAAMLIAGVAYANHFDVEKRVGDVIAKLTIESQGIWRWRLRATLIAMAKQMLKAGADTTPRANTGGWKSNRLFVVRVKQIVHGKKELPRCIQAPGRRKIKASIGI